MRIYAFQGTRFTSAAGDAGKLAAPPFDQIDDGLRDKLQATSPHHFSHLTRPLEGEAGNAYVTAAQTHERWRQDGAVAEDGEPSLYPYVIDVAGGGRQVGLLTLIGVEPASSGIIRPHESTLDKPFADRLNLLRETKVDFEPVMFLSDDPGTLQPLLEEDLEKLKPVVEHEDASGNRHVLYRLSDPERIRLYQEVLAPCSAAIADGHHRYKVGRTYAEEVGAEAGTGAGAKMTVIFSISSDLVIDPIHRGFEEAIDLEALRALVKERRPLAAEDGNAIAAAVAEAPQPALAVQETGDSPELWLLDPERMPAGSPPGAETLAVAHLHSVLLPALGFTQEKYLDGTVSYRSDPETLYEQVASGALATGVWLPPMTSEAFGLAISKGDLLPAKATRFLPKLASGLVWARHAAKLS